MSGPIDVFMVAGQSNAQGRAPDNTLSPATVAGMAFERTTAGTLVQLDDPVGNADTGSAWPAFANALTAESAVPVCITTAAVGGTWLLPEYGTTAGTHWGPGSSLFDTSVSRGLATLTDLTAAGWTPTLRGVLWCQGEYDGMSGNTSPTLQADYQAALVDLHDRYKTALGDPGVVLYVSRTGHHTAYTDGFAAVRAAQDAACAATPGMEMVFTKANTFHALGYMADGFHYTQQGYNLMGEESGAAVAGLLGYSEPVEPPPAVDVARSSVAAARLLLT